jgi:peroxiredoxin
MHKYAQKADKRRSMSIRIGESAPDFTLTSHLETEVTLSDFRGQNNVVIAFFPLAFTPV